MGGQETGVLESSVCGSDLHVDEVEDDLEEEVGANGKAMNNSDLSKVFSAFFEFSDDVFCLESASGTNMLSFFFQLTFAKSQN